MPKNMRYVILLVVLCGCSSNPPGEPSPLTLHVLLQGGILIALLWLLLSQGGCKHKWTKWSDEKKIETHTSFDNIVTVYRTRECKSCNQLEEHVVVRAGKER